MVTSYGHLNLPNARFWQPRIFELSRGKEEGVREVAPICLRTKVAMYLVLDNAGGKLHAVHVRVTYGLVVRIPLAIDSVEPATMGSQHEVSTRAGMRLPVGGTGVRA